VLDFAGDLRGTRLGLHFLTRLREQMRFPDRAALVDQIRQDVAATRGLTAQLEQLRSVTPIPLGP
jgi:FAD synthase